MWQYTPTEALHHSDELRHGEKKDFKYYTKIPISNKKSRYFYSMQEWLAYKNKGKKLANDKIDNLKKVTSDGVKDIKEKIPVIDNIKKELSDFKTNAGSTINDLGKNIVLENLDKNVSEISKYVTSAVVKKVNELKDKLKPEPKKEPEPEKEPKKEPKKPVVTKEDELKENQDAIDKLKKDNPFPELPIKDEPCTKSEDMTNTNPNYGATDKNGYVMVEYTQNCPYCTMAYDLRRRGYDVEANGLIDGAYVEDIETWYEDAKDKTKLYDLDLTNQTGDERCAFAEKEMLKNGEGSSGHLFLYWAEFFGGGGHDCFWEIQNNKCIIRDAQTNETIPLSEYISYSTAFGYLRTDNLTPSKKCLVAVRERRK